jgi:hypothetical protein
MYSRKTIFKRKYSAGKSNTEQKKEEFLFIVTKLVGNKKNDGTHVIMLCKRPSYYPTEGVKKKSLSTSKIKPLISM